MKASIHATLHTITIGFVVVLAVALGIGYITIKIQVKNEGLMKESQIVELNNDNTLQFNSFTNTAKEMMHIANTDAAWADKTFKDAVTGPQGNINGLMTTLQQRYPQFNHKNFEDVIAFVKSERKDYQLRSKQMQSMLSAFRVWRATFPNSLFTTNLPDQWLVCQNDQNLTLKGQACEEYLMTISQPYGSNNGGGQREIVLPEGTPFPKG